MSDLSLEDQNFVKRQTEWIGESDGNDDFVGDIIAQIRVAQMRDAPDHQPPFHPITAVQGIGCNGASNDPQKGVGVHGIGDPETHGLPTGTGVLGFGLTGVRGESQWGADNGRGVTGVCTNSSQVNPANPTAGVLGQGFGPGVPGVRGEGELGPGVQGDASIGVQGVTDQTGIGVQGLADQGQGVWGQSNTGPGVFGQSDDGNGVTAFSSNGNGVDATSSNGFGVIAASTKSVGVRGISTKNHAVLGDNWSAPVTLLTGTLGRTSGCYGVTLNNRGVSGVVGLEDWTKNKPGTIDDYATGVFGQAGLYYEKGKLLTPKGFAGVFLGPVVTWGSFVNFVGPKSAAVPHPDGSHRLLYCLESPESWFEDFGEAKLVKGKATVKIDKDFAAVAKTQAYHVFLTPYGESNGLYVNRRNRNEFEVREQSGGRNTLTFSYRVVARRKDVPSERLPKFDAPPQLVKAMAKQKSGKRKRAKTTK